MTKTVYRYIEVREAEREEIDHRRNWVFRAANSGPRERLGLALSGGGIRSATFCLGVLQALAKEKLWPGANDAPARDDVPLLAQFDYLSTVSGGGYTGSFFSSLFRYRPGELQTEEKVPTASRQVKTGEKDPTADQHAQTAENVTTADQQVKKPTADQQSKKAKEAYDALRQDPPGRMGHQDGGWPTDRPLRWLRENGRYLAPNSTGDIVYDAAIAVRNLLAVHYVWGITLLTFFTLVLAIRFGLASSSIPILQEPARWLEGLLQPEFIIGLVWLSPWFAVLGAVATLFLLPLGVAYWLKSDVKGGEWVPIAGALVLVLLGSGLLVCLVWPIDLGTLDRLHGLVRSSLFWRSLLFFLIELLLALVALAIAMRACRWDWTVVRTKLTQWTSLVLAISLLLLALAVVETAAQSLYVWLKQSEDLTTSLVSLVAAVGVAITGFKQLAPFLAQPGKGSMLSRLPLDTVLAMSGLLFLAVLLVAWNCAAIALYFNGELPSQRACWDLWILRGESSVATSAWQFSAWTLVALCAVAAGVSGWFLGFVNLSSLQTMYSARLTRAYLGASNEKRFSPKGEKEKLERVTEPHKEDDFTRKDFYEPRTHYGPVHVINVTVNATTGSGDQLTQRDRQGLPMAVTPAGFVVNGDRQRESSNTAELTIGQWVGISGAAFSTGTGRGTSFGRALSFSLANVRLGWWWKCGKSIQEFYKDPSSWHVADWSLWRNQAYLLRELRGRFLGTDGSHWYLSDGGHFDNTGVYELLGRRVDFIVCCDCGADPQYSFEDLANLMRIARIDFGAEFKLIEPGSVPFLQDHKGNLDHVFARDVSEFRDNAGEPSPAGEACALLYRVTYNKPFDGLPNESTLLVLKPRLLASAPLDLLEYRSRNPDFPQQSTGDQFFDEAQWESYRKLGVLIGSRIFQTARPTSPRRPSTNCPL